VSKCVFRTFSDARALLICIKPSKGIPHMKILFAVAAVAAALPVYAQSTDGSWTGAYVGGRIGYSPQLGDGDERLDFDTNLDGSFGDTVRTAAGADAFSPGFCGGRALGATPAAGCKGDEDSLDWAVHAGYDYDFGGPVVGVVAEAGIGYSEDHVTGFSTTPANYVMTRRMKENAGLRLRAGYAFGSARNTLVYATGGGVYAKMDNSFTSSNTANQFTLRGDDTVWGYRVGGGVEQRVTPNLSFGLQYLFTSLADNGARVDVTRGTAPATNPFLLVNANGTTLRRSHSRFATHNIGVTANYRF
jgi:outer membrane immunogenic protein